MCCCFSLSALKWTMYINCILVLGVGSVLVWVGFLIQSSEFVQVLQFSYSGFIVIACGGVLIGIAFLGIIGAWKERKFFLTLFIILGVVIGVLLITFGGVLIYIKTLSEDYLKDKTSCISKFEKADTASKIATEVFCTLYCPCSLDTTIVDVVVDGLYKGSSDNVLVCNPCESIQTYTADVQDQLIAWIKNELGYTVTVTNCGVTTDEYENAYFEGYTTYLLLIQWMEEKFMCSGLCTAQELFMFSDVNQGIPVGSCFQLVSDWVQKNFLNYGVISIILGIFQLSILFFAAILCCCPRRRLEMADTSGQITKVQPEISTKSKRIMDTAFNDDLKFQGNQGKRENNARRNIKK